MKIPRPATVEEARLFVGTVLERRFLEKAYFGWYTATISEVGRLERGRGSAAARAEAAGRQRGLAGGPGGGAKATQRAFVLCLCAQVNTGRELELTGKDADQLWCLLK